MVDNFKLKILRFFARDYYEHLQKKEQQLNWEVNQRVAEVLSQMDPFEPLMKQYHGVFNEEFERVEDNLDESSRVGMMMWGWGQSKDPYMERMLNWIMDTAGNTMLKAPARTDEDRAKILMWGKAQIANMVLLKRELHRLGMLYQEKLKQNQGEDFDETLSIE